MPATTQDKRATFRKMHESGCFAIPTVDVGSALALQHLDSRRLRPPVRLCMSIGKPQSVTVDDVCTHLTALCAAVDLPVNADSKRLAMTRRKFRSMLRAGETGVAGLSIEDSTAMPPSRFMTVAHAIERIRAAASDRCRQQASCSRPCSVPGGAADLIW